ncbi:OpgC domain-containing protein [Sulfitobacter aestuariivivens]|uniref:OpgC domain-containing protein n=1 Tax=Sulfitobacter aestuariivivens TaxID=2766981 RepID=UPI0036133603
MAVFVVSMFTARIMGFAMDVLGRDTVTSLMVNLAGACVLVATAYVAGWFKSQPWRARKGPRNAAPRCPQIPHGAGRRAHRQLRPRTRPEPR